MEQTMVFLEKYPIAIYGTGFVAERFYEWLKSVNLDKRVCCFCVSEGADGHFFQGKPVVNIDECEKILPNDAILCLAVHEALEKTLRKKAEEEFSGRIVWVGGMLHELLFGPFSHAELISVSKILHLQSSDSMWMALRYALICAMRESTSFEKDDSPAAKLYIKGLSLSCEEKTAGMRIDRAGKLVESISKEGFDPEKPILIDTDYRVLDGMHRLVAAAYLGIREIPCRVAQADERFDRYLGEKIRLSESVLKETGFEENEIQYLKNARQELLQSMRQGETAVSLIIPVYNVEDYNDTCMETVTHQTFKDLEILLINDGSTDGSLEKCRDWAEKDSRIQVITRENKGVAASRNEGVDKARGNFIAFIDPDDWIDLTYIEKLYHRLIASGADYAECDLWRYDNRTGKKRLRTCYGRMGVDYSLQEHMSYCATAPYKSMSRRSLWTKNNIRMPSCSFESPAVYALVVALAGGVESIREPLYYYRIARENSLVENGYAEKDGSANNTLAVEAMDYLIHEFRRCGIYETYAKTLEEAVRYRLGDILATQFFRKRPDDYGKLVENHRAFLEKVFPGKHNENYLTWGGYNLNRIMAYVNMLHDPNCRFNFSSMAAVSDMDDKDKDVLSAPKFSHHNRYRQIMLQRESDCSIWEIADRVQPSYVFIDLIEERFDLIEKDGRYFTKSDAFDEGKPDCDLMSNARVIPRLSEECTQIWKDSCRRFVGHLKTNVPDVQLVVIENYLSERVGDLNVQSEFSNIAEIRKLNGILREYYRFLEETCPEAVVVPAWQQSLYFTDKNYQYGAVPSHLNEIVNQKIAEKIGELLW